MLAAAGEALGRWPREPLVRFAHIEAQLQCGQNAAGRAALAALEDDAGGDFTCWRRLTEFHVHCGAHADAERCAQRAAQLRPADHEARYALASALVATGRMGEAEQWFDALVREAPEDGDASYNRATLRRQTPERNHVPELERILAAAQRPGTRVAVCHALAKELEDLGDYERSFAFLKQGADARRAMLSYRVESDEAAMASIARSFDAGWCGTPRAGCDAARPIFIVGLPRSGTTLVERILGMHSEVGSVGEVNDLALAVTRIAGASTGAGKMGLIERAAGMDCAALGAAYWQAVRGHGSGRTYIIDKTPLNFLYLGLVARAMPRARIVHLRRHPMASGYAMYKTLFRMGYPFSYDLTDLGRYYLAYHRLMAHWRAVLPEAFLDLDYEALVDDTADMTRRLLQFCGLPWQDRCLEFHADPRPSATASAAQVRRPIYRDSLDQWRHYSAGLAPLATVLARGGVDPS